jgi:hypothetical protein
VSEQLHDSDYATQPRQQFATDKSSLLTEMRLATLACAERILLCLPFCKWMRLAYTDYQQRKDAADYMGQF